MSNNISLPYIPIKPLAAAIIAPSAAPDGTALVRHAVELRLLGEVTSTDGRCRPSVDA
jgi:hypothetical protein